MNVVSKMGIEQLMAEENLNYIDLIEFIKEKIEEAKAGAPLDQKVATDHFYATIKLMSAIIR